MPVTQAPGHPGGLPAPRLSAGTQGGPGAGDGEFLSVKRYQLGNKYSIMTLEYHHLKRFYVFIFREGKGGRNRGRGTWT